jgi:hypothetical protein
MLSLFGARVVNRRSLCTRLGLATVRNWQLHVHLGVLQETLGIQLNIRDVPSEWKLMQQGQDLAVPIAYT